MNTKTCSTCGQIKSIDEFYRHKYASNGVCARCKACTLAYMANYRANNLESVRTREREFARSEYPRRKGMISRLNREYKKNHPEYCKAKNLVAVAVRNGTLKPHPCWVCGNKAEAHHPDYSAPLDVVWLCRAHHKEAHAAVRL